MMNVNGRWRLPLLLLLCITNVVATAQVRNTFGYTIANGLPSNHVYGVLQDRLGYLWTSTDKGIARYNGYEFRVFNQADGISNEDVWELCEDKTGKIWLSNISNEFGYLLNYKYHNIIDKGRSRTVYPRDARPLNDGVIFWSYYIDGTGKATVCFANKDTLYKYAITKMLDSMHQQKGRSVEGIIDEAGQPIAVYDRSEIYRIKFIKRKPVLEQILKIPDTIVNKIYDHFYATMNGWLFSYPVIAKSNKFYAINFKTHISQEMDISSWLPNENINYIYFDNNGDNRFYVVANDNIMCFQIQTDSIRFLKAVSSKDLFDDREIGTDDIRFIHINKFWGDCVGTSTNGLVLGYHVKNVLKKQNYRLEGFHYIGGIPDSISFWWNDVKNLLATMDYNATIKFYNYPKLKKLFTSIRYGRDSFFVCGVYGYFFNYLTGTLTRASDDISNLKRVIMDKPGVYYAITGSAFGKIDETKARTTWFDSDRYNGLVYDSIRRNYWAYNFDRIYIHGPISDTLITKSGLANFGIQQVVKILVDNRHGNLFFKGSNNLTVYDPEKRTYREILGNFNLKDASVLLSKDKLIVAGGFGTLVSKIHGRNRLSAPLFYPNIKNRNFKSVYDCIVLGDQIYLETDQGTFSTTLPTDSEIERGAKDNILNNYRFVLSNNDTAFNFRSGDTVFISQTDERLQFDIINPFGNGRPKYQYRFTYDSTWHELNANELTLPRSLTPDMFYEMELKVQDNVWKSDAALLHLFIRPLWYQTATGRHSIWALSLLLIALTIAIIMYFTRRAVLKTAHEKNSRMELELRSLYAQLNPHFVFNTLNSALNMIKTEKLEDASLHISKFARLLRSYLDSSRKRFVTLSEELKNIRNYIEIQQMRFAGLFTYEIISDAIVDPEKVIMPSLLLQPIVENAISHGLVPKEKDGRLKIEVVVGNAPNEIICIIEDNGIGRKNAQLLQNENELKKESHGDNLVKELIAIVNQYEKFRIDITYIDKQSPESGTIVHLKIKNEQYDKI